MNNPLACGIAAILGLLGVALGAFGAHGLQGVLEANHTVEVWRTAVLYHLVHAVMLYVVAGRTPLRAFACWCFGAGIVLFSGSLYVLAITHLRWLGAITPFGGASFLAGWLCLAIGGLRGSKSGGEPPR